MQLQLNYFDFSGLPGRKNNLPALDARRAWKSLSPKTDTDDLNSFKSSSEKKNNLFVIHCSRNSYMEWHRFISFSLPFWYCICRKLHNIRVRSPFCRSRSSVILPRRQEWF